MGDSLSTGIGFPSKGRPGRPGPGLACALLCLGLAGCSSNERELPALGTLERDRLELPAQAHEPIVEITVHEGARVAPDQILLRLDTANATAQLDSLQAQVSAARHRLTELSRGPRSEEILQARARLEGAESRLQNETREYERLRELVGRKLISASDLDRQEGARDAAEAARKEAQAQLAVLLKGTRIEELDQARDTLEQTEAQLRQLKIDAARLTVSAPRAGVIEALPYKLGERPPAGAPVVVMLADGAPYARVYVPAALRTSVKAGSPAKIRIDGEAQDFQGQVRYISAEAAFTPYFALNQKDRGRLSYLAEVTLTEPRAAQLPAGVPVEVRFE